MSTRIIAMTASVGVAAAVISTATFGGGASAGPPSDGPIAIPPTTVGILVPTTLPPPPIDEVADAEGPSSLGDHAPTPTPVTTLAVELDDDGAESDVEFEPDSDATSPAPIEIDPEFTPDPEYLAPCGQVEFNLEPHGGIIEVADMTGDGTADDRLSIRKDGSGPNADWYLHLETAEGVRSEALIRNFTGHVPAIGSVVQLHEVEWMHPAPAADEVLVRRGFNDTAQFWSVFGTDERGCISEYVKTSPGPDLMLRHDETMIAGWECDHAGRLRRVAATRLENGTWDYRNDFVRRDGPTAYLTTNSYGIVVDNTSELPYIGGQC